MPKKKLKPEIIHTREGCDAAVAQYVRASLQHAGLLVAVEQEKAAIDRRYAAQLAELGAAVEIQFASVQNYCAAHRAELLPDEKKKKSFETNTATVGFADNPSALDKCTSETYEQIARRLQGLVFRAGKPDEINCATYVVEKPALDKEPLKAAIEAETFTAAEVKAMGLRVKQEERFYITPKSELLETTSAAA